jgi:branched-chain amino acid transport system ATP-binding protein
MLTVRTLDVAYGAITVLRGVSLHVKEGEVVAIVGANGAGKTTLLKAVTGLVRPTRGDIRLRGASILATSTAGIVAAGCSLVPEGRQIFGDLSVRDNLLLGGYVQVRRGKAAEVDADLKRVLDMFPILGKRSSQLGGTLSGGEQQMLAIGRALMARPTLLMLDEPSMGLAPLIVKEIFEVISRISTAGCTVLLVEQNARGALKIASRGYVLETGRIVLEGSAEDLLSSREMQRAYLGRDVNVDSERGTP